MAARRDQLLRNGSGEAGGKRGLVPAQGPDRKGREPRASRNQECREETGFTVAPTKPLGEISYVYSRRDQPGGPLTRVFKKVHFFLMRPMDETPASHDDEIDDVAWVALDEAGHRASYKSERELIAKARSMLD
jgi:8-oxo-dGTP pyrophosphatase MutT (NUDIX family)